MHKTPVLQHHSDRRMQTKFGWSGSIAAFAVVIVCLMTIHSSLLLLSSPHLCVTWPWNNDLCDALPPQVSGSENPIRFKSSRRSRRRMLAHDDESDVSDDLLQLSKQSSVPSAPLAALLAPVEVQELKRLVRFTKQRPSSALPKVQSFASNGEAVCPPKRRLVFTLSTGHTGTLWLAQVLKCSKCTGVVEHEPPPGLGSFPYVLREGREATKAARRQEKIPELEKSLQVDQLIYAETSHMFVKAWWDVITEWLARVDPNGSLYDVHFVVLRRNISSTIRSFLTDDLSWNPAVDIATSTGGEYVLHHRHMAILPPLFPHGSQDAVDEIIGYLADMELQIAKFRTAFPQYHYWDVRAEEIFTPRGAWRLLRDMGLAPVTDDCLLVLGGTQPVNDHVSWRSPELLQVDPEVWRARALLFQMRYEALGIPFPRLPHLHAVAPCEGPDDVDAVAWCEQPLPGYSVEELKEIVAVPIPMNMAAINPPTPLWHV
jgi:hypothetical protein